MRAITELCALKAELNKIITREYTAKKFERPTLLVEVLGFVALLRRYEAGYASAKKGDFSISTPEQIQGFFDKNKKALIKALASCLNEPHVFKEYPEYTEMQPILEQMLEKARGLVVIASPSVAPILHARNGYNPDSGIGSTEIGPKGSPGLPKHRDM